MTSLKCKKCNRIIIEIIEDYKELKTEEFMQCSCGRIFKNPYFENEKEN